MTGKIVNPMDVQFKPEQIHAPSVRRGKAGSTKCTRKECRYCTKLNKEAKSDVRPHLEITPLLCMQLQEQ